MTKVESLIAEAGRARRDYLSLVETLSEEAALIKPAENKWNAVENTEHLFWAER